MGRKRKGGGDAVSLPAPLDVQLESDRTLLKQPAPRDKSARKRQKDEEQVGPFTSPAIALWKKRHPLEVHGQRGYSENPP